MSATWSLAIAALLSGALGSTGSGIPRIGTSIADFELTDSRRGLHRLSDWDDSRIVILVFLGSDCPIAGLYGTRIAALAAEYQSRGVSFIGVAPNRRDSDESLDDFAKAHRIGFPILKDTSGEIAARLGARRTPEVVVLDDKRVIRYRGRIDDQYAVGSRRAAVRSHDLVDALEELLGGRPVGRPETDAVGCPIEKPLPAPTTPEVSYYRDIAPILHRRCVECHRPGQIGPFPLTDYRQVEGRAGAIAEVVEEGRMPPWHANPRHGRFANDARMSDREKRLVSDWVRGGAPEGDPADLPPSIDYPGGWRIPDPDLVVPMPRSFTVPAAGVVDFQVFEVDPGFREDRWVRAAEIRPGNRRVVHHCTVFLKAPRGRGDMDTQGELGSFCLAATAPGAPPMLLPDGMAKRVPAGWRFLFVVHYAPIGTTQSDRTSIGLLFAEPGAVKQEVATNVMVDPELRIPPFAADHRVAKTRRFDKDVLLLSMFPHMHLRGKSFRYEATHPDGRVEILLDVPRYDLDWQNSYQLAEPKRLSAGTILRCIAHYDNSKDNPANPNPAATVLAGDQIWDEMFNGYYDFALADQDLTRPMSRREAFLEAARKNGKPALPFVGAAAAMTLLLIRLNRVRRARS